jgi:hypothetical protein
LALHAVEFLDLIFEVFFDVFHSGHMKAVFLHQGLNAQLAHPLVDSQNLDKSRDLNLVMLSFHLIHVPAELLHGLKLLLDILDGRSTNLIKLSFQISCDFLEL